MGGCMTMPQDALDPWYGIPQRVEKPSSGGVPSSTYTYFSMDMAPATPSAYDDEFTGASLDPKWTKVNWGNLVSEDYTGIYSYAILTESLTPTSYACGLQALPAGDFCLLMRGRWRGSRLTSNTWGLVISSTNTAGSGSQCFVGEAYDSATAAWRWRAWTASNFSTFGAWLATNVPEAGDYTYLRLRRSGSNYYAGWCVDGYSWTETAITPGFTPSYFGFGIKAGTSDGTMFMDFVRYKAAATATLGGTVTLYSA